jgi:cleavage and polyadenylation specificity factor subunit 1
VCGSNPHWIFMTARGELRTHPMTIDGEVLNFAPFNNINCPQGFLYFNKKVSYKRVEEASTQMC